MKRIVLAYSGSLETSVAIPWLAGKHGAEIVTVTMDLGQGSELETVRDRALAAGAVRAHVLDVRDEFARDYVLRALKADAMLSATALGQPLLARKLVEMAAIEQAGAVAHGGSATGNDGVRLDLAVRALNPSLTVFAPAREWGMTRREKIEYARTRAIPVPGAVDSPYRIDANLWGRTIDCGVLEEPWPEPPEECPGEAACVEITFERGVPTAINGVVMPLVELIASLGTIAGAHGVGRGMTLRRFSEAPAPVVLHTAHKELQRIVSTRDAERFSRLVSLHYADLVDSGQWCTPLREALDACVDKIQERVSGVVRLTLFKGDCRVVGRNSAFALDDRAPGAYDAPAGIAAVDPAAAVGVTTIVGLHAEAAAPKA